MATTKKRINITLPDASEELLTQLAKRDQVPRATKASELLRGALELEEDVLWDRFAKERDTKDAEFVSHDEVWKWHFKSSITRRL